VFGPKFHAAVPRRARLTLMSPGLPPQILATTLATG
jgi:hypothetical protein